MKIQIIQLDPHDDYISARDKIGWIKTGRILLVIPEKSPALVRELDLVLLKRHCESMGAQMALVTKDEQIHFRARKLGIPLFSSVSKAYRKHWRISDLSKAKGLVSQKTTDDSNREKINTLKTLARPPGPAWINRLEFRLLFFAVGVFAVLAIAAVLMPGADITLHPKSGQQEIIIRVSANPKYKRVNISGAIPAQSVSIMVEGRDQATSSGTIEIDDQPASGSVVFSNLTDKPVTIPAGTIVRTAGSLPVRFSTSQEVVVQAGYGITTSVPVQALKAGIGGNLAEGSLTAIEGMLGVNLLVENLSPTFGGSSRTSPVPISSDKNQLFERLQSTLVQSALKEINNQLVEGDILLSTQPVSIKVINQLFDPAEDMPADQLNLILQLECDFLVAKAEDLIQLSTLSLNVNLPKNYAPVANSLSYSNISIPVETGKGDYRWQINASRKIQARVDPTHAVNLTIGLPPAEAVHRLAQNLPLAEVPQIKLTPAWWWRLPILPFRVSITIQ